MFGVAKTTQLIAKLASTATTEMKLLKPGRDFVSRTITPPRRTRAEAKYTRAAMRSTSWLRISTC